MKKERRRLTIITNTVSTFGGGERWAFELIKRIKNRYRIALVNPTSKISINKVSKESLLKDYGLKGAVDIINIESLGIKKRIFEKEHFILIVPKPRSIIKLKDAIKSSDVVYILSSNPLILSYSTIFANNYRKKLIFGVHNPYFPEIFNQNAPSFFKSVYKTLFRSVKYFHVLNSSDFRLIKENIPKAKVSMIPNFVYGEQGKPKPNSRFTVLFVGRLQTHQKGIDLLRHIIENTISKNYNIAFRIAGSGGDGEETIKLLQKKYPENVRMLGFIGPRKLNNEYNSASLLIFPSRAEAFPLTLLEAQGHGLPVIAYDIKGPNDLMRKEFQGRLIAPFDSKEFAKEIINYYKLWASSRKRYAGMKKKIIKNIYSLYSTEKIIPKLAELFDE